MIQVKSDNGKGVYSGRIAIQWFKSSTFQTISIRNFNRIPFGLKMCVFSRIATLNPRLTCISFQEYDLQGSLTVWALYAYFLFPERCFWASSVVHV